MLEKEEEKISQVKMEPGDVEEKKDGEEED